MAVLEGSCITYFTTRRPEFSWVLHLSFSLIIGTTGSRVHPQLSSGNQIAVDV